MITYYLLNICKVCVIYFSVIFYRLPTLQGVLQGYGMTEATGAVTEETTTDAKQGSVGKLVQGNVLKVI